MTTRSRTEFVLLTMGLAAGVLLAGMALLATIPLHRTPVQIADGADPGLPPDYDALLLQGHQEGEIYVATLTVAGVVQASGYNVMILGQDLRTGFSAHVYRLGYWFGAEKDYGIRAIRDGGRLTFYFPLSLLIDDAYIVGLEAVTWPMEGNDFVREQPRESLHVSRLLALPLNPNNLAAASATLGVAILLFEIQRGRKARPDSPAA